MNSDIQKLLLELDWNNKETHTIAIKELSNRKDYDLKVLIAPLQIDFFERHNIRWKNVALGCATVISSKSDDEIMSILPDLLIWFQDLNWPGAVEILERLKKIPYSQIEKHINDSISRARQEHDEQWIEWLTILK